MPLSAYAGLAQTAKCPLRGSTAGKSDRAREAGGARILMTPREAERVYGATRRKLACSRRSGTFPPYVLVSGCVLYRRSDIELLVANA